MFKTYLVDGQPVRAENDRHAVKYYLAVLNREPDIVEFEGKEREVCALCENSSLGIFCDDVQGEDYHLDSEGIHWLTDKAYAKAIA